MAKIQFKTFSNVSLDAYLFKNFKFFDLHNQGRLSSSDFFRAIAKCGVVVETHVLMYQDRIWQLSFRLMQMRMAQFTIKISLSIYFLERNLNQSQGHWVLRIEISNRSRINVKGLRQVEESPWKSLGLISFTANVRLILRFCPLSKNISSRKGLDISYLLQ